MSAQPERIIKIAKRKSKKSKDPADLPIDLRMPKKNKEPKKTKKVNKDDPNVPSTSTAVREGYTPRRAADNEARLASAPIPVEEPIEPQGQLPEEAEISERTLGQIISALDCNNINRTITAIKLAINIIEREDPKPIVAMIDAGIASRCIQFLRNHRNGRLQFNAAELVISMATGVEAQTKAVVDAGVVEPLIELLNSPDETLIQQAMHAIGEIVEESETILNRVINMGVLPPLVRLVSMTSSQILLGNTAWLLSRLCSSNDYSAATLCYQALTQLIRLYDWKVVGNACWALSFISNTTLEKIDLLINCGVVPRLIQLLSCEDSNVVLPCLLTLAIMTSGTNIQTQYVIDNGVIPYLIEILQSPNMELVEECALVVSNILGGTYAQCSKLIDEGVVPLLVDLIQRTEFPIQRQAVKALVNITAGAHWDHIYLLFASNAISAMALVLDCKDAATILNTLNGFSNILIIAQENEFEEDVALAIEECGAMDVIEGLQEHANLDVYQKSYFILDTFFKEEKDGEAVEKPAAV